MCSASKRRKGVRPEDLEFGSLFEKIRDGGIVADAKSQRVVLWNSAATSIFGYSPSEALKLRVEDLVPERFKAQHRAGMARYHKTGRGPFVDANRLLAPACPSEDRQGNPSGTIFESYSAGGRKRRSIRARHRARHHRAQSS